MTQWASAALQNGGINYLKSTAVFLTLVSTYAAGDSVATVAANKIAESAMVNADFTINTPVAGTQRVTSAAKNGVNVTATTVAGANTHWVFRDAANVIYVTKETTEQAFTTGNTTNFPALWLEVPQPTVAP